MNKINLKEITAYVEKNIHTFHDRRLEAMKGIDLKDLLKKKNPYLFKAKHMETASELIESLLDARLSSSEEEIIGDFLEGLSIFVASKTLGAHKSGITGFDFEYETEDTHYVYALKSGENWGNSSQWDALEAHCKAALKTLSTSGSNKNAKCMLGICYGKSKTSLKRGIITQVSGQQFWYTISGEKSFYQDIVEPIGNKAKERNEAFAKEKGELVNKLTYELLDEFCDKKTRRILWDKLVKFNSGNLSDDSSQRTL
jgi:Type II restriction endonuclease EcoO109I